jgi:uncharacterized protein involved in outer membrane biogenesis
MSAPEVAAVARVRQFRADRKRVAAMRDAAGEHRADAQTPRDGLRVALVLFEAEDGAARYHLNAGQLRQAVDQAVGQSVNQIFSVRVGLFAGAGVNEGQHGQRINRGLRGSRVEVNQPPRHAERD